jgi:hypothetical protein
MASRINPDERILYAIPSGRALVQHLRVWSGLISSRPGKSLYPLLQNLHEPTPFTILEANVQYLAFPSILPEFKLEAAPELIHNCRSDPLNVTAWIGYKPYDKLALLSALMRVY